MQNVYWLLAVAVGAGLAIQAGVNAQLRAVHRQRLVDLSHFGVHNGLLLGAAQIAQRDVLPVSGYGRFSWWIWMGGLAGAAYVLAVVAFTRYLGVAMLFAAIIVGQLSAGLIIDHFGWFKVPIHRISLERLAGAALLLAGMALIRWR